MHLLYALVFPGIAAAVAFGLDRLLPRIRWYSVCMESAGNAMHCVCAGLVAGNAIAVFSGAMEVVALVIAALSALFPMVIALLDERTSGRETSMPFPHLLMNARVTMLLLWVTLFSLVATRVAWREPFLPLYEAFAWLLRLPWIGAACAVTGFAFLLVAAVRGVFATLWLAEYLLDRDGPRVTLSH